jgi:hypothetical protein
MTRDVLLKLLAKLLEGFDPFVYIFVALVLASCAHGPRMTYCTLDDPNPICSTAGEKAKDSSFEEIHGWICLKPSDQKELLASCKTGLSASVEHCEFDSRSKSLQCPEKRIPVSQTLHYICASQNERRSFLEYCKRKSSGGSSDFQYAK